MTPSQAPALPVTVVIPAFNRAAMLPRAIASIEAQRPARPAEIIVVDDASSDDTAQVAERLGAKVLRHDTNRGPAEARNTGFGAATQPWIAQLDSDDEWLPSCLATLWSLRGDHLFVTGGSVSLLPGGEHRYNGTMCRRPQVISSPATLLFPDNFVAASGVLLRTAAVREVGGYRPGGRYAEDLDLWVRLLERGTGVATPRVVTRYHVHEAQATSSEQAVLGGHRDVAAAYAGRPWWEARVLRRWGSVPAWHEVKRLAEEGRRLASARRTVALLADPQRAAGLATLLRFRLLARRRSLQMDAFGEPTVAALPGTSPPADRPVDVDLRDQSVVAAAAQLARRPTGEAIVGARWQVPFVRMLRIKPVTATRPEGPS